MSNLRVREMREAAGMTKVELARRAGLNERTVRKIESGHHTPSLTTTIKLADALKVPVRELLGT